MQALTDDRWVRTVERQTREGGVAGVRVDVTEVVLQERELKRLNAGLDAANLALRRIAGTDPLTGGANRRSFDERLARAGQRGGLLALLWLDVDHFKRFNDRLGHPAGDAVLRRVAAVLVASARAPDDLVARVGGEEFAVLLPGTDGAAALHVAERFLSLLVDADIAHDDSPIGPRLTASVGVALRCDLPPDAGPATLLELADSGLYEAKAWGRHRVVRARARNGPSQWWRAVG